VPPEWISDLEKVDRFLVSITRPDGTLPAHGDTVVELPSRTMPALPQSLPATEQTLSLYPLSGYAVWSAVDQVGRVASHTVVTWSYFRGHPHKHADESEVILWARGRGWITPSGYAPYGHPIRSIVVGPRAALR
jgi:hypothetical protein